jgi:hypothetical protein
MIPPTEETEKMAFDRTKQQTKTKTVSVSSTVGASAFAAGVHDYQNGIERFDEFAGKIIRKGHGLRGCAGDYERGRQFAAEHAGRNAPLPPLKIGRTVNRAAILAFARAYGPDGIR